MYDDIFRTASNMHYLPLHFDSVYENVENEFVLWLWKGDYWGLQGGAEIGLYWDFENNEYSNRIEHFHVVEFELPMTLSLYKYTDDTTVENKFSWAPEENQWWITGFNPKYVGKVDVKKQVMIGSVDFSKFTTVDGKNVMYSKFEKDISEYNYELLDFMTFDKENDIVWLLWCERYLLQ